MKLSDAYVFAHQEPQERQGRLEHKDSQDHQGMQDSLDLLESQATQAPRVGRGYQDLRAARVSLDSQVHRV